jgi:hypothetical protein
MSFAPLWIPQFALGPLYICSACLLFHYATEKILPQLSALLNPTHEKLKQASRALSTQFLNIKSLRELTEKIQQDLSQLLDSESAVLETSFQENHPVETLIKKPIFSSNQDQIACLKIGPKTTRVPYSKEESHFLETYAIELSTPLQNILLLEKLSEQLEEIKIAQANLMASEKEKTISQEREKNVRSLSMLIMQKIYVPLKNIETTIKQLPTQSQETLPILRAQCQELNLLTKNFLKSAPDKPL